MARGVPWSAEVLTPLVEQWWKSALPSQKFCDQFAPHVAARTLREHAHRSQRNARQEIERLRRENEELKLRLSKLIDQGRQLANGTKGIGNEAVPHQPRQAATGPPVVEAHGQLPQPPPGDSAALPHGFSWDL